MMIPSESTAGDAPRAAHSHENASGQPDLRTVASAFSHSAYFERFLKELAYYEADQQYLTAEKCAERCRRLSALFTALARGQRT